MKLIQAMSMAALKNYDPIIDQILLGPPSAKRVTVEYKPIIGSQEMSITNQFDVEKIVNEWGKRAICPGHYIMEGYV